MVLRPTALIEEQLRFYSNSFLALGGRTADLLQHRRIVVHGRMLSRHRWQSRCDNGIRIASSSGRKRELDIHVAHVGMARFAQTLGTYVN